MILYINNEHCSSIEQLKGYFKEDPSPYSDIFADLLDYGRYGDIAVWLREMGEPELAFKIESISDNLPNSKYYSQLKLVITGNEVQDLDLIKPPFGRCFTLEDVVSYVKDNKAKVSIKLKVLKHINEEYELCVSCNWGIQKEKINPYNYTEGETIDCDYTLDKSAGKVIKEITIKADGKEIHNIKIQDYEANVLAYNKNPNKIHSEKLSYTSGSNLIPEVSGSSLMFDIKGVKFKMIYVEGGCFTMGATPGQWNACSDEMPAHQVRLNSYYIGETQVTQALWMAVMDYNPSLNKDDNNPVECVSWDDCQKFVEKLNQNSGKKFRLPTEAEWEYAARGGGKSGRFIYAGSNSIDEVAWYIDNSGCKTQPVATKKANELGLYDMSGNVEEWCQDWYGYYSKVPQSNSTGPSTMIGKRVVRGGAADLDVACCRSSSRFCYNPSESRQFGLRLVLSE